MPLFNKKNTPSEKKNLAGGKAFAIQDPKEELFFAALTTFFKDNFYESGDTRLERIKACIAQILEDEKEAGAFWLCQLCLVLREQFHMRSVTHVIIGEVAKNTRGIDYVARTIPVIAKRPDDLSEIAAYVGSPMPKQVKRGIRRALQQYDRYQLAKYQMKGREYSLVDLFNLTHPNPELVENEVADAWADLIAGNLKSEDTWEDALSNAKDDAARRLALCDLIAENKIGYMALLRNLNNFQKYNVPERLINIALEKLTDPEEVSNSRLLPFRFWNAYKNVKGNVKMSHAIGEAMDIACVENGFGFEGNTLIAIDSSGSMHNGSDTSYFEKASILAAILLKQTNQNSSTDVILYSDRVVLPVLSSKVPLTNIVSDITNQQIAGGAHTSLVFSHLKANWRDYERVIILSDNQSWGDSVQKEYTEMRSTGMNPDVYAIDIAGYGTFDVKGDKVTTISGWSDRIIEFISAKQGKKEFMNLVGQMYLPNLDNGF